jgi:hypothetical protein
MKCEEWQKCQERKKNNLIGKTRSLVYRHTGKIHYEQSLKDEFLREGVVSIRSYERKYKKGIFENRPQTCAIP